MGRCALASGWLSGPSCLSETTRWEAFLTRNPWPPAAERVKRLVTPPRATRSLWCWTGSQVAGATPTPPAQHPEPPRGRPTGAWEKGRGTAYSLSLQGRDGELQNGDARGLHDHLKGKWPNHVPAAWLAFQQFPIYPSPQTQLCSGSAGRAKQGLCVHMCMHV